ncbi:hypothetical protein [Chitinophaga sp. HK235]|uniref:hypothetical protein n=1 Tax=Chitinophaga sp. HK235 TaxID=2952571 RepID=UPI001BA5B6F2|nr:hypothetical protein [Chitinophaga sp. HK235]
MKTNLIAFVSGYIPAFVTGLTIPPALVDAVAKIIVAAIVGFVGGYMGLAGKAYYERKNKKDGRN